MNGRRGSSSSAGRGAAGFGGGGPKGALRREAPTEPLAGGRDRPSAARCVQLLPEAVYQGWCPSCEAIVTSGWDNDVTDVEVQLAWLCPGCGMHVESVRRVVG